MLDGGNIANQETLWQRLVRGARRLRERSDWQHFAGNDWGEHIMATGVTDRFHAKQGRSTGRWILKTDGKSLAVYLKRHYRLPWWQGLAATLWPNGGWSPALQEWRHLEWARSHGLPVPAAVAAGEYIGPWGQLRSFLAVEELTGMLPLHEAIPLAAQRLDPISFRQWKRGLVIEMARLTRDLHQRHHFHKDLYLCHFYIPECDTTAPVQNWQGRVYMIDLHRLGHHPWTGRLWQIKDLAQLLYSSEVVGVDARDRLRFWKLYLQGTRKSWLAMCLRRLVLLKWRRYRSHNRKKQGRLV